MLSGTGALIRKELINFFREPKSAFMIFFPIVLFLTVFVFASTKDITNSSLVVFNQDSGIHSKNLLENFVNTDAFKETLYVKSEKELTKHIDTEKAFIGIIFPQNFSKNIISGRKTDIQVIMDGRRTNAATITYGYLSELISKFQNPVLNTISIRTWYNPNKDPLWFSITNLICMIIVSQAISLACLSLTREKEEGTFDQLLVSPIKPFGILIGKIIPGIIISLIMGLAVMILGSILYGVPIYGSIGLLLISMFIYIISVVGIGVFISAFANTQQQAMLGTFIFQMPMMSLSGITCPVQSIKIPFMQAFVKCNPVAYANKLISGIMLKNMSFSAALESIYPLFIIAIATLFFSSIVFAKKYRLKIL
ncbi:MAG: ABC transporter permease [Holosporales bacterium]|jgi:ABC-2 type transport system permease protein|nr:ABC transporter permease [Holosporales bacterium]